MIPVIGVDGYRSDPHWTGCLVGILHGVRCLALAFIPHAWGRKPAKSFEAPRRGPIKREVSDEDFSRQQQSQCR